MARNKILIARKRQNVALVELHIGGIILRVLDPLDHLGRKINPGKFTVGKLFRHLFCRKAIPATNVKDGLMGHLSHDAKDRRDFKLAVVLVWICGLVAVAVFFRLFFPEIIRGLWILFWGL